MDGRQPSLPNPKAMAINVNRTQLLSRATSLVFTVAATGILCTSTCVLGQSEMAEPPSFVVLESPAAGNVGYPPPNAIAQAAAQTRPRRVNPGDPPAQPSPAGRANAEGAPTSSGPRQPRPDPPNPKLPAKAREAASTAQSYTIQVGAFLQLDNARRLAQSVSKKGYTARVISLNDSHGKKWHCVRVGNYPDRDRAIKTAEEIETKLNLKPIVRSSGSL
jgi:cell division septation protein DedD